ncbi:hypothetical protein BKA82DRAFT_4020806 [Pisolithus tinctorius]|nr:hypothetical protein BKA82DRAFT_4020806 [Pisolithus tinctorius]
MWKEQDEQDGTGVCCPEDELLPCFTLLVQVCLLSVSSVTGLSRHLRDDALDKAVVMCGSQLLSRTGLGQVNQHISDAFIIILIYHSGQQAWGGTKLLELAMSFTENGVTLNDKGRVVLDPILVLLPLQGITRDQPTDTLHANICMKQDVRYCLWPPPEGALSPNGATDDGQSEGMSPWDLGCGKVLGNRKCSKVAVKGEDCSNPRPYHNLLHAGKVETGEQGQVRWGAGDVDPEGTCNPGWQKITVLLSGAAVVGWGGAARDMGDWWGHDQHYPGKGQRSHGDGGD